MEGGDSHRSPNEPNAQVHPKRSQTINPNQKKDELAPSREDAKGKMQR